MKTDHDGWRYQAGDPDIDRRDLGWLGACILLASGVAVVYALAWAWISWVK